VALPLLLSRESLLAKVSGVCSAFEVCFQRVNVNESIANATIPVLEVGAEKFDAWAVVKVGPLGRRNLDPVVTVGCFN
jgi:hypothetical protein